MSGGMSKWVVKSITFDLIYEPRFILKIPSISKIDG